MNLNALLKWDLRISNRLRVERPGPIRTSAAILAHSGDSWFWLAGLSLLWLLGDPGWKRLAVIMAGAILGTAVFVLVLKFLIRRPRPEGDWGNIYRRTDPHSFPSGHAARAFLLAVIALGLAPGWFGLVIAIWAPLVALARVLMGVHFLSDITAGILIGTIMGLIIVYASQAVPFF